MTLREFMDKLTSISDETDLESEVWFDLDGYNSKFVSNCKYCEVKLKGEIVNECFNKVN